MLLSVIRASFAILLAVTPLSVMQAQAQEEEAAASEAPVVQAEARPVVRQILVQGNQRVESDTVLSYMLVQTGQPADARAVNLSIQTLFATGLFSDVRIEDRGEIMVVYVQENPIINQVRSKAGIDALAIFYNLIVNIVFCFQSD